MGGGVEVGVVGVRGNDIGGKGGCDDRWLIANGLQEAGTIGRCKN